MNISMQAIGMVSTNHEYRIIMNRELIPALKNLEGFSHIIVFWYANQVGKMKKPMLVLDKPYRTGPEKIGVFATRSPLRPNCICSSIVQILHIDHATGTIDVSWIDAFEGTPILDIKPYHPSEDRIRDAKVPQWCSHWPQYQEDSGNFNWDQEFLF